ncbi:alpha/beta hydrolase [Pseudarthrobacter phenanthrenivorans]|uniref:alpha/beta fold hydrolase n=1 Tax=Pseudarthrobacter phenanthrenivorans TaxID=361575 RepID=UPI0011281B12|nr:alpha/beta hydrolase [Pseudarthrobacter phenanthrenivorans]TPV47754.1 alpha/beta hydrolase [Pseudarthrobacter phenanthrenivorans]
MDQTRRVIRAGDGVEISYVVIDGSEPAIVILHGLAGSGQEFLSTARALPGRKSILVDQRGHGRSTRLPSDTSRDAFVSDVVLVIEGETSSPVHLVGHSMGAHTAMLAAAARPDLVRTLVLLECGEGGGSDQEHAALGEYFRSWPVPFSDPSAAARFLGDGPLQRAWVDDMEHREDGLHPRFDPEVMVAALTPLSEPRWTEWTGVQAPALVVYADDGMFTEEQKAQFVERGNNVTRVDLAGGSHDAHLDAFEQWIEALSEFLDAR